LLSSSNQAKLEWNAAGVGDTRHTYRFEQEELRGKRPFTDRERGAKIIITIIIIIIIIDFLALLKGRWSKK
jgi:hypothetical protein